MQELPIDENKLNKLVVECRNCNVFALQLPFYENAFKIDPVTSLLEDIKEEALSYLGIMSKEEVNFFVNSLPHDFKFLLDHDEVRGVRSLDRIALYYIIVKVYQWNKPLRDIITNKRKRVLEIYPEIESLLGKDDLIC